MQAQEMNDMTNLNEKTEVESATETASPVECLVMPICDDRLQITYLNGKPRGIRDRGGILFLFPTVSKYIGQEERYRQEIKQQHDLVDYLLKALREA